MTSSPRVRLAVRALVLDDADRVLLARLEFPTWAGWVLPGGGIEEGEDEQVAIRRELAEETGLVDAELVGPIWERTVIFSQPVVWDGQTDRIYFVRAAAFEPEPHLSWDHLRSEGMTDLRWWTIDELVACTDVVAPSRLASLVADLVEHGLPATVIDVGE